MFKKTSKILLYYCTVVCVLYIYRCVWDAGINKESVLCTVHCVLSTSCVVCTVYLYACGVHALLKEYSKCTVYCELCTVYCVLCTVYCVLCTVHCVLCTVYCSLCTVYCVLCTVYCVLCT